MILQHKIPGNNIVHFVGLGVVSCLSTAHGTDYIRKVKNTCHQNN
jgi:hypothetical protein